MAPNPFEQLELFLPESRIAFEELAKMLLQDYGKIDGRVSIFLGMAGSKPTKVNFLRRCVASES